MLVRRLVHAVDNYGWRQALNRAVRSVRQPDLLAPPQPLPNRPQHPFDVARGVDTGGYVAGEDLGESGSAAFYATGFQAVTPSGLQAALDLLPESPEAFTFVDLGCGKGRGLIVAAEFQRGGAQFSRLVGVELSASLSNEARQNILHLDLAQRIDVRQGDAACFFFPDQPLVVYLYHPFLPPLLRQVLRSLKRQLAARLRPVYLLYANLSYHRQVARERWLVQVWDALLPLSAEDVAANHFDIDHERYTLYRAEL